MNLNLQCYQGDDDHQSVFEVFVKMHDAAEHLRQQSYLPP